MGKLDEAIGGLAGLMRQSAPVSGTAVSYAYLLLKNAELQKAEEVLQKVIKEYREKRSFRISIPSWHSYCGKKGDLDQAVSMLDGKHTDLQNNICVRQLLGFMLIQKGDPGKALELNRQASISIPGTIS